MTESRKEAHMCCRESDEVETGSKEESHACGIESQMRCASIKRQEVNGCA